MTDLSAPRPIAELWQTARAWLAETLAIFGGPQTIQQTLDRVAQRAIKRQLQALQTLAMKLLLIEAAKLAPRAIASHRARNTGQERIIRIIDPARPETWRVCFQLHIPPEPAPITNAPRIRSLGPTLFIRAVVLDAKAIAKKLAFLSAARASYSSEARAQARAEKLARRFEALRRIFANPMPSARRLKRKLAALKQGAMAAARRLAMQKPPPRQLDPIFNERAEYAAHYATPAFAALNSS